MYKKIILSKNKNNHNSTIYKFEVTHSACIKGGWRTATACCFNASVTKLESMTSKNLKWKNKLEIAIENIHQNLKIET